MCLKKMERAIYSGIFNDEIAQRYLRFLVSLANKGFYDLYNKCFSDNSTQYRKGLERVTTWSNGVFEKDLQTVMEEWPDCSNLYEQCFINYVKSVRGVNFKTHKLLVNVPSLIEFVRIFMISLSRHDVVQSGKFFESDVTTQRICCMDTARDAFFALDVVDNVQMELRSQVSAVAPSQPVHKEISLADTSEADLQTLAENVKPDDSVSNIGKQSVVSEKKRSNDEVRSVALSGTSERPKKPKSVVSEVKSVVTNRSVSESKMNEKIPMN